MLIFIKVIIVIVSIAGYIVIGFLTTMECLDSLKKNEKLLKLCRKPPVKATIFILWPIVLMIFAFIMAAEGAKNICKEFFKA